jgi:Protein of unknown function (DUF3237)
MKIASNQFESLLTSRQAKTPGDDFPPLGIRDQLKAWRQLPSCTFELITVTVQPKPTPDTWRQIFDKNGLWFTGGTFSGPLLRGSIAWTFVTGNYDASGRCIHIHARAKLLTHDGVTIYKNDRSRWLGYDHAIERLVAGEEVANSDYYLIGVIEYSVSDPSYAWLKTGQYLNRGLIDQDHLHLSQFKATPSD